MDKTTERDKARSLGLKKYKDDVLCRYGHKAFKHVHTSQCMTCAANKVPLYHHDAHVWSYYFHEHNTTSRSRVEALQNGESIYFTGSACKRGHKLIRNVDRGCVGCAKWREVDGVLVSAREERKLKAHNLIGKQFGDWTVLDWEDGVFVCRCKCGNVSKKEKYSLINYTKCASCAQIDSRVTYLGKTFGKVTIIAEKRAGYRVKCTGVCECGYTKEWLSTQLNRMALKYKGKCQHNSTDAGNISAKEALLKNYKQGAVKRGYSFTLSDEQFFDLTAQNCHYCDHSPMSKLTYGGDTVIYNGVDRQDNASGYEPDNCVTACRVCNMAKGTRTLEDFLVWLARIKKVSNS